jgi:protocatechuate 3,4-dioxygenase beta subunit
MDRLNYNVLQQDGIVRSDIRQSISGGDVQAGAMLTLNITLTGTLSDCASLAGYAVYIWHCTSAGDYSVYTESSVTRNYLRGVQATGSDGKATFVTVMPGCYEGRMPHIHVEIYPSLAEASSVSNVTRITQLAFPSDVMQALYGTQSDYSDSVRPFSNISFEEDNVFSDGYDDQMLTITGDSANGYVGEITISIAA